MESASQINERTGTKSQDNRAEVLINVSDNDTDIVNRRLNECGWTDQTGTLDASAQKKKKDMKQVV